MALWPTKKGQDESPDMPSADNPHEEAGQLQQLTRRLGELGQLLDQANEQVAAYLLRRESTAAAGNAQNSPAAALTERLDALAEKIDQLGTAAGETPVASPASAVAVKEDIEAALRPLREKTEEIEKTLKSLGRRPDPEPSQQVLSSALGQINDGINAHHQTVAGVINQVRQQLDQVRLQLDGGIRHIAELLRPPEPEEEPDTSPAGSNDWQRAILGSQLAGVSELAYQRQQLLDGVLAGEKAARALVGQLLVFRSAAAEKMPPLLKEIGEAYYRWQPKAESGSNPMEEALAAWLKKTCDEAGIGNTIELVHPGERFDSTRHTASQRGVEITQVLGWIVLRDNGRVYTKAAVAVR